MGAPFQDRVTGTGCGSQAQNCGGKEVRPSPPSQQQGTRHHQHERAAWDPLLESAERLGRCQWGADPGSGPPESGLCTPSRAVANTPREGATRVLTGAGLARCRLLQKTAGVRLCLCFCARSRVRVHTVRACLCARVCVSAHGGACVCVQGVPFDHAVSAAPQRLRWTPHPPDVALLPHERSVRAASRAPPSLARPARAGPGSQACTPAVPPPGAKRSLTPQVALGQGQQPWSQNRGTWEAPAALEAPGPRAVASMPWTLSCPSLKTGGPSCWVGP